MAAPCDAFFNNQDHTFKFPPDCGAAVDTTTCCMILKNNNNVCPPNFEKAKGKITGASSSGVDYTLCQKSGNQAVSLYTQWFGKAPSPPEELLYYTPSGAVNPIGWNV